MVFGGFGGGNRISVKIVGDKTDLDKKLRGAGKNVDQFGQRTERGIRKAATAIKAGFAIVAASAVAVGVKAIKLAADFDSSMSKITGLVGIAADEVDAMGETVKRLAGETAKSPAELADALFFVTSAGLRGAEALEALEFAAKASAAGLGETAVIADALTSAMNAYATSGLSAEEATNILVATVREGKLEASALGAAIGQVLPIASEMGVTFDEVGASIAAMTRLGLNSAEAVTALKSILTTIIKPAGTAAAELEKVGLSSEGLRRQLREEGLLAVLFTLREAFKGNQEALTKVIPNVRALTGFMALTGDAAEATEGIFERLTDTTGNLDTAFGVASETIEFRLNKVLVESQLILLKALPLVETLLRELMLVTGAITELQALSEISEFDVGSVELASEAISELITKVNLLDRPILDLFETNFFVKGVREILKESELTSEELKELAASVVFLDDIFGTGAFHARKFAAIIEEQLRLVELFSPELARAAGRTEELAGETEGLTGELEGLTGETEIATEAAKALAEAEEEQAEALDEASEAAKRKRDALLEVHNPLFRITQLSQDLEEAERAVIKAENEFTRDSSEFVNAVINRADVLFDLRTTFDELLAEGINPTGEAARNMFRGLGAPDDVIDKIFGVFDEIQTNLRDRLFSVDVRANFLGLDSSREDIISIPREVDIGGIKHTGGRVNAPRGQEVLVRALGGETFSNPSHSGGGGGGSIINYYADTQISNTRILRELVEMGRRR